MNDHAPDYRHSVWLYREPWRSLFLLLLLALLGVHVVDAARGALDSYRYETLTGLLVGSGLVYVHVSAAYVPLRWRGAMMKFGSAVALGVLLWTLVR
jgi:succinate dehydrogenase hydrophobic anchor subunit